MQYDQFSLREKIIYFIKKSIQKDNELIYRKLPNYYSKEYIGGGEYGDIFKINDSLCFKSLYGTSIFSKIKALSNYQIDGFVFPETLVFKNDIFIGYLMKYIDGHTLNKDISYLNINTFLKELMIFEKNILLLSKFGIYATDIYSDNIMIDKKGKIYAIDTDFYETNHNNPYKHNISIFSRELLKQIIILNAVGDVNHNYTNNKINDLCFKTYHGECLLSELIRNILFEIELLNIKIESIKDLKMSLKLISK